MLFIAILFGISISLVGEPAKPLLAVLESASEVVFRMVRVLMKAAPIGALGAFAFTIGKYGIGTRGQPGGAGRHVLSHLGDLHPAGARAASPDSTAFPSCD